MVVAGAGVWQGTMAGSQEQHRNKSSDRSHPLLVQAASFIKLRGRSSIVVVVVGHLQSTSSTQLIVFFATETWKQQTLPACRPCYVSKGVTISLYVINCITGQLTQS